MEKKNDFCEGCRRMGKDKNNTSYCWLFNQYIYPDKAPRRIQKCEQLKKKSPAYFEQLTGLKD